MGVIEMELYFVGSFYLKRETNFLVISWIELTPNSGYRGKNLLISLLLAEEFVKEMFVRYKLSSIFLSSSDHYIESRAHQRQANIPLSECSDHFSAGHVFP